MVRPVTRASVDGAGSGVLAGGAAVGEACSTGAADWVLSGAAVGEAGSTGAADWVPGGAAVGELSVCRDPGRLASQGVDPPPNAGAGAGVSAASVGLCGVGALTKTATVSSAISVTTRRGVTRCLETAAYFAIVGLSGRNRWSR